MRRRLPLIRFVFNGLLGRIDRNTATANELQRFKNITIPWLIRSRNDERSIVSGTYAACLLVVRRILLEKRSKVYHPRPKLTCRPPSVHKYVTDGTHAETCAFAFGASTFELRERYQTRDLFLPFLPPSDQLNAKTKRFSTVKRPQTSVRIFFATIFTKNRTKWPTTPCSE